MKNELKQPLIRVQKAFNYTTVKEKMSARPVFV